MGPAGLLTSPSATQPLCPPWFQPRFPYAESYVSDSIKPFIPSSVTQEQPELILQQRNPSVLSPHSLRAQGSNLGLPPESSAPAGSLSVSSPAVPPLLVPFVVLCWQFTDSCLRLPPGAQPASGTAAAPSPLHQVCSQPGGGGSGSEVVSVLSVLLSLLLYWELQRKQSNCPQVESDLPMMATGEGCPRLYVSSSVLFFPAVPLRRGSERSLVGICQPARSLFLSP